MSFEEQIISSFLNENNLHVRAQCCMFSLLTSKLELSLHLLRSSRPVSVFTVSQFQITRFSASKTMFDVMSRNKPLLHPDLHITVTTSWIVIT